MQLQCAAQCLPVGGAEYYAFGTGFQLHGVLQAQLQRAAHVQRADRAVPLLCIVQAAGCCNIQRERLFVDVQAALRFDLVLAQRAVQLHVRLLDLRTARADAVAFERYVQRTVDIGRGLHGEIDILRFHGIAHGKLPRLSGELGFHLREAVGGAGQRAFGGEQPLQAEAEQMQVRRMDVQGQRVATFAERALRADVVAAQLDVGVCLAQMFVFITDIALSGQGRARYGGRRKVQAALEGLFRQFAAGGDFAIDVAFGQAGIEFGGIEALAFRRGGEFLALEQLQAACNFEFAALVGQDFAVFNQQRALPFGGVGGDFERACALGAFGFQLPRNIRLGECAFGVQAAVERALDGGGQRCRIGRRELFDFGLQVQRLLLRVNAAVERDLAVFHQLCAEVGNFDGARIVDVEGAGKGAHGNAALVGRLRFFVAQIQRAVQRHVFVFIQIRMHAQVEHQIGLRQVRHERARVDVLALDIDVFDKLAQMFGKRADLGTGM